MNRNWYESKLLKGSTYLSQIELWNPVSTFYMKWNECWGTDNKLLKILDKIKGCQTTGKTMTKKEQKRYEGE